MNQSYGSSYVEILFLSYEKTPKVKIVLSNLKESDIYWLEDSPLSHF